MILWEWISNPTIQQTFTFIGGGIAAVAAAVWAVFRYFARRKPSQPSPIIANNSGIAGGHDVTATAQRGGTAVITTGPVNIGITLEEHHAFLRQRETAIREELTGAHREEKSLLAEQLEEIRMQLTHLKESYQDRIGFLQERIVDLEKLKDQLPADALATAQSALIQGDTSSADELFRQIEERSDAPIKQAAEAIYQRGRIAESLLRYHDAYGKYLRATQLQPDDAKYHGFAGLTALRLGLYDAAIGHHETALRLFQSRVGDQSVNIALERTALGNAWLNKNRFDKAIEYYESALRVQIATFGENHRNVARNWSNLGIAWKNKGEYDKAIQYFEKALKIDVELFGENHPHTARELNNLGNAVAAKSDYDKAIQYFEKALKVFVALFGENHPDVAINWTNLGGAWASKGEYNKAIEYFEKALKLDTKFLGENHANVARNWNNLGTAWSLKGEHDKAIEYFEKALKIHITIFGENHPHVATIWTNLGAMWHRKGDYDKAIAYYQKALKTFEPLSKDHAHAVQARRNLQIALQAQAAIKP